MLDNIKGYAQCKKILFPRNKSKVDGEFAIAKFSTTEEGSTMPEKSVWFTLMGNMYIEEGQDYKVAGTLDKKGKYKDSYTADRVAKNIDLENADSEVVENFLLTVLSESKAKLIIEQIPNPIKALEDRDVELLTSVKGIGEVAAEKIIDMYYAQKDYTQAYVELAKYHLTKKSIEKICKHFGGVEKAIAKVIEDPYCLTDIDGYGFSKADAVFLSDYKNNKPEDPRRVRAYIKFMFEKEFSEGNTWLSPIDFIKKVKEYIPNADAKYAVEYVISSDKYKVVKVSKEEQRITTSAMFKMEMDIVRHLHRIMKVKTSMKLDGYENSISLTERSNGWEYNPEQRDAIENMIDKNIYMLQGLAGTGKSTTVKAFLNVVEASGYKYAQSALSGKAANNLSLVTGKQGSTIHSLLGAGRGEEGQFKYNEGNPLEANVIVLDELSMVDLTIFWQLIRAIRTGSKLIMIGDYGQLEAIGVGVMGGLIRSKVIPMTLLKKIHRQSQDSAIITHSISIRNGQLPDSLNLKKTNAIYGVKQDLEYLIVDDDKEAEILGKTMLKFKEALTKYPIEDIQIACSTKKTGVVSTAALNRNAQMLCNPRLDDSKAIELGFGDDKYEIRVGDKIINMKNTKSTSIPIYNGSTGMVKDITIDDEGETVMVANFEGIGTVEIKGKDMQRIELGYAATVHKLQGSTIKYVIFALPFHFLLNTKELVYTGMTRASDYQVLVTSAKSFRRAIKNTSVSTKKINLDMFLKEKFEE